MQLDTLLHLMPFPWATLGPELQHRFSTHCKSRLGTNKPLTAKERQRRKKARQTARKSKQTNRRK